jgi:hypothetical protein
VRTATPQTSPGIRTAASSVGVDLRDQGDGEPAVLVLENIPE